MSFNVACQQQLLGPLITNVSVSRLGHEQTHRGELTENSLTSVTADWHLTRASTNAELLTSPETHKYRKRQPKSHKQGLVNRQEQRLGPHVHSRVCVCNISFLEYFRDIFTSSTRAPTSVPEQIRHFYLGLVCKNLYIPFVIWILNTIQTIYFKDFYENCDRIYITKNNHHETPDTLDHGGINWTVSYFRRGLHVYFPVSIMLAQHLCYMSCKLFL